MNREKELIIHEIEELKKERNAVILAHNYQLPEVQEIADFTGDSFELSIHARSVPSDVILFCGVHFMAEVAAILCPDKTVLLPDLRSGCPLADTINPEDVRALKEKNPSAAVVSYINTPASVKALSDACCTSSNAVSVVKSLEQEEVIFLPDKNLASYVTARTGKKIIPWRGFCPVHECLSKKDVEKVKQRWDMLFVAHPECRPEVLAMADQITSTSGIIKFVKYSLLSKIIIGTEIGIINKLREENPDKTIIPASERMICLDMKYNTLEKIRDSLREMKHMIKVPDDIRSGALGSIERMMNVKNEDKN